MQRVLEITEINLFTGTMKGTFNKRSSIIQATDGFDHCEFLEIERMS
jgi:hypothetical protein